MYSELLLRHFNQPRNVGVVENPDAEVEAVNPACGDVLRLSVRAEGQIIREARFQSRGCTAAIACGSALTEWLVGRNLHELSGISAAQISGMVGILAPESQHAAVLCVDAVQALRSQLR